MYVLRKHLGTVRRAARWATERGDASEAPVQKFLKLSLNLVMIEVKGGILGDLQETVRIGVLGQKKQYSISYREWVR